MELVCSVQKYDWGKRGEKSLVALLAAANRTEFIIDNVPYAELWMGTHPSGPSLLKKINKPLSEHLSQFPDELGKEVLSEFGATLPFLFKVLSVETALSIQAHPAKTHAEVLFQKFPDSYKDPNHKPELAIALTDFEALCGFRPRHLIKCAIKSTPLLQELLGQDKIEAFINGQDDIRVCFEGLMKCNENVVRKVVTSLAAGQQNTDELKLLARLNTQFPGDVGCLCVFWLNHLILSPGEALFLAPNEPHAYISGSCVECMANSDNVVRAGLTPKFRDTQTLCAMLTYKSYEIDDIKFKPEKEDQYTLLYKPPVKDFAVAKITLPQEKTSYRILPRKSASILLVISGKGTGVSSLGSVQLKPGCILYLPVEIALTINNENELVIYQAHCNV